MLTSRTPPAWSRIAARIQDAGAAAKAGRGRGKISVDRDTVIPRSNTVTGPWNDQSIPSSRYRTMPYSPPTPSCESSMGEIECKQALEVHSNATVDLSVSSRFSVGARPVLPMSGTGLLTIEWE